MMIIHGFAEIGAVKIYPKSDITVMPFIETFQLPAAAPKSGALAGAHSPGSHQ